MLTVKTIAAKDNLKQLVDEINQAVWAKDNEMSVYDVDSLTLYLKHQGTVFVACHEHAENHSKLLGIASARLEIKPYDQERWLYVDEVDVCADQRQKGAGKAMMQKLIQMAQESGCEELWLGTEVDNIPANALYRSLQPDEVEKFIGYAYETVD